MNASNPLWLIVNARSGSNNETALNQLVETLTVHSLAPDRIIAFPDDDLPTAADLDGAGVTRLCIFTGDGTLNAAIAAISGWGGEVVVLPGGTMNLLSNRLHGVETTSAQIITRIAANASRRVRPIMARCDEGDALAGLLVGPGTAWANVREAMRDLDVAAIAQGTSEALAETTGGAVVRLTDPATGHEEGYPLIEITPSHRGMQLDGFRADNTGDFLQQGWALLRRRFREGPNERLGLFDEVTIENCEGGPIPVLIDGEPATLGAKAVFKVAPCEVDLLATDHGF